ncbi:MAG: glycosyltransferase [Terracidiphilus sp.]|jgi:glycosyltransferase involved in cell wall biosynthesis
MRVAIAWHGLPYYGARLIRPVAAKLGDRIAVIATPGPQSSEEIEAALGAPIHIAPEDPDLSWRQLAIAAPDLFFHTGWAYANFRSLAREVERRGGTVVSMVDNSRKHSLRQVAGKRIFRWRYRPQIDLAMVPGASGLDLMKYLGMPDSSVYTGLYGADPETFQPGPPWIERPCHFLFAGQFVPRKGLRGLVEAVNSLRSEGMVFRIAAVGAGPMRADLESAGIEVHPFAEAPAVARMMREARFLVLPSIEDHWGMVAHEAALSGCGLILSSGVGSHRDLLSARNGFLCEPGRPAPAMRQALLADPQWLSACLPESLRLASKFGPERWSQVFEQIYAHAAASQHAGAKPRSENPVRRTLWLF